MNNEASIEITAERILATAQEYRITIEQGLGIWYDRLGECGCAAAVAAIALRSNLAKIDNFGVVEMNEAGMSNAVICGLSDGFEGEVYRFHRSHKSPAAEASYLRHYAVGQAVAEAVAAEGGRA